MTPPNMQKLGSVGPKGVCLRMREIVIVRRLFFVFFFTFMLIATGLPVGPIIAVNGLNGMLWWHSHSFYGLVKKNWNLPPLTHKIWKFALRPMATLKSRTPEPLKIRARSLQPNWWFWGLGNLTLSFKFLLDHPCCHGNKLTSFGYKIGHYSASIRDITQILAPSRGFSGSFGARQFNCISEIYVRLTPVAMETKFWKFPHKIYHNSAPI